MVRTAFLCCMLTAPALADGAAPMGLLGDMSAHDLHMTFTPDTPARAQDAERARELALEVRAAIARYADPELARADGYSPFLDDRRPRGQVHFTHRGRTRAERRGIDAERPGSLLYMKHGPGDYELIGAMFTAPQGASLDELDAIVPVSQAQWHLHTDLCLPRRLRDRSAWQERDAQGRPIYGTMSPIATEAECDAVGGRFQEAVLGWMVHVYPFGGDPEMWWRHDQGGMH